MRDVVLTRMSPEKVICVPPASSVSCNPLGLTSYGAMTSESATVVGTVSIILCRIELHMLLKVAAFVMA